MLQAFKSTCHFIIIIIITHRNCIARHCPRASWAQPQCPLSQKSLSRLPLVIKGLFYNTASQAATLVSDQDYSLRPNRHIINTLPPPSAAVN
ncbi:hypothetical protein BKA64DRAFT_387507 [Cadophora sp. MPI-SDFR-AT-0126]|nr:hypothetical protein BKA64DRAFT_387507 [Leotiomycetes sp. MPI-SDFR-AT-0126]